MLILIPLLITQTDEIPFAQLSSETWFKALLSAFLDFIAKGTFTQALQLGNPMTVGLLTYLIVFYNWLVDLLVFHFDFSALQLVGMLLTISACVANAVYESCLQKQSK